MFSIKLNGSLCDYFAGAKGLRQGDPLSPYLFSIAMNILSCMLDSQSSTFKHHWRCKELDITHLFFADDVLLFSHGDVVSIDYIMQKLMVFSQLSGLKPNTLKSHSFMSNCSDTTLDWFDSTFSIPRGTLPVKFLGVPLIVSKLPLNRVLMIASLLCIKSLIEFNVGLLFFFLCGKTPIG